MNMEKNTEKKEYESPTMTVVELNVDEVLLQCSDCSVEGGSREDPLDGE